MVTLPKIIRKIMQISKKRVLSHSDMEFLWITAAVFMTIVFIMLFSAQAFSSDNIKYVLEKIAILLGEWL